jgi:hypothetical protein
MGIKRFVRGLFRAQIKVMHPPERWRVDSAEPLSESKIDSQKAAIDPDRDNRTFPSGYGSGEFIISFVCPSAGQAVESGTQVTPEAIFWV